MKQQKGQTWRSVNWQDAAAIRRLLQSGADPNEPLSIGMRPLHRAVRASHDASEKKIVQMLLQRGADPSITDEEGITPLVLAARMNNVGAVRALVERWRNHDDMNRALHMAARYGHHEIVMSTRAPREHIPTRSGCCSIGVRTPVSGIGQEKRRSTSRRDTTSWTASGCCWSVEPIRTPGPIPVGRRCTRRSRIA
ncbi:ankyrin repeat domain-containing protein [bacterium]|nr:ankyrin repeat domain-containing protein [bacterium]